MSQFVKTALSHKKLRLEGEHGELTFDMYKGNPQLVFWSRHTEESDKRDALGRDLHRVPVKASTSWPRLHSVLLELQSMVGETTPCLRVTEHLTIPRDENRQWMQGADKIRQALMLYGRDDRGELFIEIRVEGRPAMRAYFREDDWHRDLSVNKAARPLPAYSDFIAAGMIQTLRDVFSQVFVKDYDPDFKPGAPTPPVEEDKYKQEPTMETPPVETPTAGAPTDTSLGW